MSPEGRLKELGLELPQVPAPVANFRSWHRSDQLLFLSGQGPRDAAGAVGVGRLGRDRTVEQAYADARRVGLQLLATVRQALGSLDHVESVVKLLGLVNAEPDFTRHPQVVDGCSDLLVEVLGERRGPHARTAIGVGSLPHGMPLEIEAIVRVADGH